VTVDAAALEAAVRGRYERGEVPADLDERLEAVAAHFHDAPGDPYERLAEVGFVDVVPDVESSAPGVGAAKRLVHRAVSFELRHLAQQVSEIAEAVGDCVRDLDERLRALEGGVPEELADALVGCGPSPSEWDDLVGDLEQPPVVRATRLSEVRGPAGTLVVSGCPSWHAPASQARLARQAAQALQPGGVLVLVSASPDAPAADLAPGRPLQPETWEQLLGSAGLAEVEVHRRTGGYAVTARRPQ
jgi:SAM-dependent methyltransferase